VEVGDEPESTAALPQRKDSSPMETFFKEAGWTPVSFCTLWKREEALGPVGNRTTILDTSIPWPNHFIEYPGPSCFNYDYKFLV